VQINIGTAVAPTSVSGSTSSPDMDRARAILAIVAGCSICLMLIAITAVTLKMWHGGNDAAGDMIKIALGGIFGFLAGIFGSRGLSG
jgi:hypothetical protein